MPGADDLGTGHIASPADAFPRPDTGAEGVLDVADRADGVGRLGQFVAAGLPLRLQ
jgi:hypothetical protein